MTVEVSLDSFEENFEVKGVHFGLRVPLDQAHIYNRHFDVQGKLKTIPSMYLENLHSLDLATKEGDLYTINQSKLGELARRFAPILVFDSKEKQAGQLGNLTAYLMALFSRQYELVKENPPEAYKEFVACWKENPSRKEFLHFLNRFTENGKNKVPSNFFQKEMKTLELQLETPARREIYVNFIPGKETAVIQYYTFYPISDQNRFFSFIGKMCSAIGKVLPVFKKYAGVSFHLGDWEGVDVYIKKGDKGFVPVGITYSGHGRANIHKTTLPANNEVFVIQGGHATRPAASICDLMFDNCDGKGERIDLHDKSTKFVQISLHNLLFAKTLEQKCLAWVPGHGPGGFPGSILFHKAYAADPAFLEYVRLDKAWQPTQPIIGKLWRLEYPAVPNPQVPVWVPSAE